MNWKMIGALLVMAVFMMSVPAAFAKADTADVDATDKGAPAVLPGKGPGAVTLPENASVTAKEKLEMAKEKFEQAKEQYAAAREQYLEAKGNIEAKREQLRACKEEATDECKLVVKDVKKDVKDFLLGAADRILASLEKVKSRVEASSMNDDTKTKIIAKLDERIDAVTAAKESISALTDTSTKAEIREATEGLRGSWKEARVELKTGAGRLANEKIHGIIVKSEQLQTKLDRTIARLSEQGYDTSGVDELKASFDEKLAEAKAHYDAAVALYAQEIVPGEVDELMQAANAEMKLAQKALQDAHKILKDIVAEIKETQEKGVEEAGEKAAEEEEEAAEAENETEVAEEAENETEVAEEAENETEVEEEELEEENETEEEEESEEE